MKKIVILGASGHAHVIADIVKAEGNQVVAFLDDNLNQSDCAGRISDYSKYPDCEFVIGIGDTRNREIISSLNLKWHTAIHPSAVISDSAFIGEGTVVMPNAVINARSIIGRHCIINTGAIVEHDNNIGDFSHISVGAKLGGTGVVGKMCWIGIGSIIKNNLNICDNTLIGAGAVVIRNIESKGSYIGIPAKMLKKD